MTAVVALTPTVAADAPLVAVPVFAGRRLPSGAGAGGGVEVDIAALAAVGFEGKFGETAVLSATRGPSVVAVGLGDPAQVDAERLRRAAAAVVRAAWRASAVSLTLLDARPKGLPAPVAASAIVEGALLASYRFTKYKSEPTPCGLERIELVGRGPQVRAAVERAAVITGAVAMARDLVNEPPGAMTPTRLAEVAVELAGEHRSLTCTVLDEAEILAQGLGGLAGVAQGSAQPPRLIRLTYEPAAAAPARSTVALVGKGITFDSGGLSLKTAQGMMTMKSDMTGAAVVLAALSVLPVLKPSARVIGLVAATENLPGGRAYMPGDVLRIRNGKTVEVLNTDAEGRLVLADALSLAVEAGVDAIVDLATLTGACVVALGKRVSGLMGNDDALMGEVRAAGDRAGEPAWPLPLPQDYRREIDSSIADIKNIGDPGGAGAITAGLFLREFVGDTPWAHLDIAGPSWTDKDEGYLAQGATAVGVRTVLELLASGDLPRRSARAGARGKRGG